MKSQFIGNFIGMFEMVYVTEVGRGILMKASGILLKILIFLNKEKDRGGVNILHACRHLTLKHSPHKSNFNN